MDLRLGKDLFRLLYSEKINKLELIKVKNFCSVKVLVKEDENTNDKLGKLLANHISDNKELSKLSRIKNNPIRK